jgi:hypothetical protein
MLIPPLTLENTPRPIEEGDAGLVLTKGGKFFVFSSHKIDVNADLTPRQLEHAQIISAFTVALQIPQIMQVLIDLSNDPEVVGEGSRFDFGKPN